MGLSGWTGSRGEFLVLCLHVAPSEGGETKITLDLIFCFFVNFSLHKNLKTQRRGQQVHPVQVLKGVP